MLKVRYKRPSAFMFGYSISHVLCRLINVKLLHAYARVNNTVNSSNSNGNNSNNRRNNSGSSRRCCCVHALPPHCAAGIAPLRSTEYWDPNSLWSLPLTYLQDEDVNKARAVFSGWWWLMWLYEGILPNVNALPSMCRILWLFGCLALAVMLNRSSERSESSHTAQRAAAQSWLLILRGAARTHWLHCVVCVRVSGCLYAWISHSATALCSVRVCGLFVCVDLAFGDCIMLCVRVCMCVWYVCMRGSRTHWLHCVLCVCVCLFVCVDLAFGECIVLRVRVWLHLFG